MGRELRGLESIKTMSSQVFSFRARTPYGATMELAILKAEKGRLKKGEKRCERELRRIRDRFKEIEKAEEWLKKFAQLGPDDNDKGEDEKASTLVPPHLNEMIIKY